MQLMATLLAVENPVPAEEQMTVNAWWYGIAAFAFFMVLLFFVTRLNLDR